MTHTEFIIVFLESSLSLIYSQYNIIDILYILINIIILIILKVDYVTSVLMTWTLFKYFIHTVMIYISM